MVKIKVGIIGGSVLGDSSLLQNSKEIEISTPFGKPSDSILTGTLNGVECVFLSRHGRKHTINPTNVNYRANIWALKELECTHVIGLTACGSLQDNILPGEFLITDSFIDLTKKRELTFYDGTYFKKKVFHLSLCPAFDEKLRNILIDSLKELNVPHHPAGTAIVIEGPRFSSYAESILYRSWGAHIINMTLVPELVLAKELALCYASIAIITDFDCWNESSDPVSVEQVLQMVATVGEKLPPIISKIIDNIVSEPWDDTIKNLQETIRKSFQNK